MRTYFPPLLGELSTLGIARNATLEAKSILAWRKCIDDNCASFVVNVTYGPTEFTPLVLYFTNELGPPTMEERLFQCVVREREVVYPYLCLQVTKSVYTESSAAHVLFSVSWHHLT